MECGHYYCWIAYMWDTNWPLVSYFRKTPLMHTACSIPFVGVFSVAWSSRKIQIFLKMNRECISIRNGFIEPPRTDFVHPSTVSVKVYWLRPHGKKLWWQAFERLKKCTELYKLYLIWSNHVNHYQNETQLGNKM